jgi:hypothetical protein
MIKYLTIIGKRLKSPILAEIARKHELTNKLQREQLKSDQKRLGSFRTTTKHFSLPEIKQTSTIAPTSIA